MEREQWDHLLAEYATGGLSDGQKKLLFAAAMENQEFFDQLMEEASLREVVELPGARDRLIRSLEPEPATEILPVSLSLPARTASRRPLWLAWAAGAVLVLLSGVITYKLLQPDFATQILAQRETPPVKEFPPPPSGAGAQAVEIIVEPPPPLSAMKSESPSVPSPAAIPLPSAPPPPESAQPMVTAVRETTLETDLRAEKNRADAQKRDAAPGQAADRMEGSTVLELRRQQVPASPAAAPEAKMYAVASSAPTLWRRTPDMGWTRLASGEPVSRTDSVAIRFVPRFTETVALIDNDGRRVLQQSGRAGQEMELIIPRYLLSGASGNSLALSLVEGSQPMGAVGGVSNRKAAPAPPRFRIILPLK